MNSALFAPQAKRDLVEAAAWIAKDNPTAARALRDTLANAARRLGQYPELGSQRPDLADPEIRFLVLTGFPYVVVYDALRRPPLILRVLHGGRDIPNLMGKG